MKDDVHKIHLPSFAMLRSFECAARHESFTLASEELHLTQSAISRQVKELELSTGVKLFRRVGRQVVLTNAGKIFAADISIDLERVRQTVTRTILAGNSKSVLRIATLATFANRWLIPRLPIFSNLYPTIEISMSTRLEPFDLVEEKFDCAVHYGTVDWPGTRMTKLFGEEIFAVSSPKFKHQHDIENLESLKNVPLLHLETRLNAWHEWFESQGLNNDHVYTGKKFDQYSMIISATIASMGAALIPAYLIENEIKSGDLIQLSKIPINTENNYFIVTPQGSLNPQVSSFVNWVKSETIK